MDWSRIGVNCAEMLTFWLFLQSKSVDNVCKSIVELRSQTCYRGFSLGPTGRLSSPDLQATAPNESSWIFDWLPIDCILRRWTLAVFQSTVVHGRRRHRHLLQRQRSGKSRQRLGALAAGGSAFLPGPSDRTRRQQSRSAADVDGESRRRWRHRDVTEFPARARERGARRESGRRDRATAADRMFGENSLQSSRCFPSCDISSRQCSTTATQTDHLLRALTVAVFMRWSRKNVVFMTSWFAFCISYV